MSASDILEVLKEVRDILKTNFPVPTSLEAFYAGTHSCPAATVTTITWEIAVGYLVKVKKLYADAVPDTTYEWSIAGVAGAGNEIVFSHHIEIKRPGIITLAITNAGAVDEDVDVIIEGWAVKEVG